MRGWIGWVCAAALLPALVMGQPPLADHVPDDAIVYIGWAGTNALQHPYDGTHLQRIMEHSDLPQLLDRALPGLIEKLRENDPAHAATIDAAANIVRTSWQYPVAIYLRDFTTDERPTGEKIDLTILIHAGENAEAFAQWLTALAEEGDAPLRVQRSGGLIAISAHEYAAALESQLGASDRFTAAISQLQDQPALCIYINTQAIHDAVAAVAESQAGGAGPADPGMAGPPQMLIPLYLTKGIDAIAWSAGFDGKLWRTQTFISAPKPRSGLAALLDAQPVSDEILRAIPQNAEWVTIRRLDLAKLHDEIRNAYQAGILDGGTVFDQVMGVVTMGLGANPKTMLFDPLGDEWAAYIAPGVGGDSVLGSVVLNRVDDPARIQRGLSSIAIAATNIATNQSRGELRFQLAYAQHNGTRISYINTPFVTPAWAVKGNLLVMGLYPQTVAAALDATGSEQSILDNETFQQMRQDLGDQQATSVSFVDLAKTAEKVYPSLLMWAQLYGGGADLFIDDVPPMLIPTMQHLRPHLTPAGRVAWVDEQGWHVRTVSPFPMAGLLAGEVSQIAQQYPMAASVIVPSLMRARDHANQVKSMSNVRQLLVGVHMYANSNDGRVPQRLSDLASYTGNHNSLDVFVRPGHRRVPADAHAWTDEQVAEWIDNNSSYIYLRVADRFGEIQRAGEVIIMHERIEGSKPTDFVAVGFADGHVESMMVRSLEQRLAAQQPK